MNLVLADEKQKIERDRLTHAAWGQRLSVEQFLDRERQLRGHAWCREGMQTWLLVDEGRVLSSCETFKMTSWTRLAASASAESGVAGTSYAFASVFTEPSLRGNGYAAKLVGMVVDELVHVDANVQSFILYSEVGEALYKRVGFEGVPSFERVFRASKRTQAPNLTELSEQQILKAWPGVPVPAGAFVIWPTATQLDWHLERERAYARLLGRSRPPIQGAAVGMSIVVWAVDYKEDALRAVFFHGRNTLEAQALLAKGSDLAAELGLSSFRVWESESFAGWERLGIFGDRVSRADDSVAMIRFAKKGLKTGDWTLVSRSLWV